MRHSDSYLRRWLRALAQPVTYLGIAMLVFIYCVLAYLLAADRKVAEDDAGLRADNLARVVDQSFTHIFKSVDATLLFLRKSYERSPSTFDLSTWVADPSIRNELTFDFGILDANGRVVGSSFSTISLGIDRSDREHFRTHANSTVDELLISKPVILHATGKRAIVLSRRIAAPDGTFAGVIVAMLDPSELIKLIGAIDLGPNGSVALVGLDGYLRTRSVNGTIDWDNIGRKVSLIPETLGRAFQVGAGHYWSVPGVFNDIRRLVSYRVLESFPLISLVTISEAEVFRRANENARIYWGTALALTMAVAIAIGFGALRERRLIETTSGMKQAKGLIEESRAHLARAESLARLGHYKFEKGSNAVTWSEGLYRIVGRSPESFTPTLGAVSELIHPDDRPMLDQYRRDALAGLECPPVTLRLFKDDGELIYVENWARPFLASDGSVIGMFGTLQDVTDRKRAEAALAQANQELNEKQYVIDQAVMVAVTDVNGTITHVNDNFCQISGYTREELLGENHRLLNSGTHSEAFFRDLYRQITSGQIWRGEVCNKAKDGSLHWLDSTIIPQLGSDGKPVSYTAIRVDITVRKLAEAQVSYFARHDPLTGIANRAVLLEKMEEALARLRQHQETFTVLIFDLDGFKYINDTLGHAAGDELLKELAQRLTSALRETDILARLGGDEFAIIQRREMYHREGDRRDANQREAAIGLSVRILEIVAQPFNLDGQNVTIGTSIGIAFAPEDGTDPGELLQKADLALYRVKSEGRNNFRFFDAEMSRGVSERMQLLADMRAALTRKEFELYYQPIFDSKSLLACGVEALVRWRHPVQGLMSPDRFIPLAEESGLMEPLGEWILEQACADAMSWPNDIKVTVNLSAVQFRSGKLFDIILCALVDSGLPPERLELEITESVLMQNAEGYRSVIQQLKNIGISITLDDFGTGYSSLSYLTMFPFDKIKIDKSFTQGLLSRADSAAIVASVLTLARGLDMVVTAEGVETKQQFELLRAAGVHHMQGYLFAKPVPFADLNFAALDQKGQTVAAA